MHLIHRLKGRDRLTNILTNFPFPFYFAALGFLTKEIGGVFEGLGIRLSVFRANRSLFAQKRANERFAQKNERFTLIFGERPERFAHDCSFPLSDLSELLMVAYFW